MTIPHLRPRAGLLALVLASALCALLFATAVDAATVARARRPTTTTCDISSVAARLGPTTVLSLKVTALRCGRGIAVVRAFHRCRLANGVSGRCVRLVNGYACGEIRSNGPTEFTSRVTCRKDRAVVVHRYQQVTAA